jgi:hypothetical protein
LHTKNLLRPSKFARISIVIPGRHEPMVVLECDEIFLHSLVHHHAVDPCGELRKTTLVNGKVLIGVKVQQLCRMNFSESKINNEISQTSFLTKSLEPRPNHVVGHARLLTAEEQRHSLAQLVLKQRQSIVQLLDQSHALFRLLEEHEFGKRRRHRLKSLHENPVTSQSQRIFRIEPVLRVLLVDVVADDERLDEGIALDGRQLECWHLREGRHISQPLRLLGEIDKDRVVGNGLGVENEVSTLRVGTVLHRVEPQELSVGKCGLV